MTSIKSFIVFICVLNATSSWCQQGNPFEISERLDSVYNQEPGKKEEPERQSKSNKEQNVFDVTMPDSEEVEFNSEEKQEQGVDKNTITTPEEPKRQVSSENPFDVSHIPIRRSKLKEESIARRPAVSPSHNSENKHSSNVFLFWYVLFSAVLIAIVVNTQKETIPRIYKSISNENILKLSQREDGGGMSGHYLLLYASFFINAAVFAYLVIFQFFERSGFKIWLVGLLIIVAVYFIRHISLLILGLIFPIRKESKLYSFTIEVYNIFLGLLLIPMNLIIAFGPLSLAKPLLYGTITLIILILIIRYLRGLFIASKYIESNFLHFFLYLCTFEIAPLLVVLRLIKDFG